MQVHRHSEISADMAIARDENGTIGGCVVDQRLRHGSVTDPLRQYNARHDCFRQLAAVTFDDIRTQGCGLRFAPVRGVEARVPDAASVFA